MHGVKQRFGGKKVSKDNPPYDLVTGFLQMNKDAKRMILLFEEHNREDLMAVNMMPVIAAYHELFIRFLEEKEAVLEEVVGKESADEFIRNVYTIRDHMTEVIPDPVN